MDAIQETFAKKNRDSDKMYSFGYRLKNQFSQNKAYRRPKELQWLEDLRAYKGLYDPDVRIEKNNSRVYPKITRSKVNIVLSRLHEMLFPATEKNWEISPTPEPTISKEIVTQIAMSMVQEDPETGEQKIPTAEELQLAIKKYAKEICDRMSTQIDDQLVEMDYSEETKKVLRSGLMYGTGIMKGPLVGKKMKRKWEPAGYGEYEENTKEEDTPELQFIRLWDWYPDMSVTDIDKMEGCFERHIMTKHDLRQLAKRSDFYPDMINEFLEENPYGNYVASNWEVDLQVIEVEAGSGQLSTTSITGATDETNRSTNRQIGKKYEVLEFWGYVDGSDLEACGVEVDDVSLEYGANVWLVGAKPIKVALFDTALNQYKVFYYEKDETSIFGEGLARIMRHSQLSIAAGARMVLDNSACVAGPMVELNWSLMTADTDYTSFYPRKIWFREGKGVDAQYPALRVYNIDSHIEELLKVIDAFKQFGDEETTLPTWMIGQMVNNETAQATSGRLSMITVSIKDVVKNFDSFTEKIIKDMYAWNMEFNPRPDIKGDFKCKARGVESLVMKEVRMQALNQLTTTMTPEDWDYIPRREFLQEKFKAHDVVIPLLSEEEVAKLRQDRQQSAEMQLAVEMQKAEIGYKKAQTAAQLTKAKKMNTESIKEAQTPIEQPEGVNPDLQQAEVQGKQTENMGKEAEIRRQEEAHAQDMAHKQMAHEAKITGDTLKTAQDLDIKGKQAEHGMKMKEVQAKSAAKAKKAEPKKKPVKS